MTNQAIPNVDETECSWADIAVTSRITGGPLVELRDIAAIKSSRSVDVGVRKGTSGGRIMARTAGEVSYDASITFYKGGLRRFKQALMSVAPTRGNQVLISLVTFDVLVQHTPLGSEAIYQRKIRGCRYLGDSEDLGEGVDADQTEVTINPIEIFDIIDGKEVVLL